MPKKNPHAVALGRKGGQAFAKSLRAGLVPLTGKAVGIPTACARCGAKCPSVRAAKYHYRECGLPPAEFEKYKETTNE